MCATPAMYSDPCASIVIAAAVDPVPVVGQQREGQATGRYCSCSPYYSSKQTHNFTSRKWY